jgi:hypothetical protein
MKKLFQITVADEQGVVIDTGWVALEVPDAAGRTMAGAALFDAVLEYGLDQGIDETREEAARA